MLAHRASPAPNVPALRPTHLPRNRNHSQRTTGPMNNLEWSSNYNRSRWWQLIEVDQARNPKSTRAVHKGVARERWIKTASLTSICAHRFYAHTQNIAFSS